MFEYMLLLGGAAIFGFGARVVKELYVTNTTLPELIRNTLLSSTYHIPINEDQENLEKRLWDIKKEIQILQGLLFEKMQVADNNIMDNSCSIAQLLAEIEMLKIEVNSIRKRISIV